VGIPGIGDMPGVGDMPGIGDMLGGIEGDIDDIGGIDGLFIGIFGSVIIFFMSASMDLQQSGCAE
jgi:hypothetical protein